MIVPAALDVEFTCAVALLQVDALGEAAALLDALGPRVEADMSAAGAIHACVFLILASAVQPAVIFRV